MWSADARVGTTDQNVGLPRVEFASLTNVPPHVAGIVHDVGNLIQIAASALNIVSRNPSVGSSSALAPIIASGRTSLQRAGALIQQTMRQAREGNTALEDVNVTTCLTEIAALLNTWESNIRVDLQIGSGLRVVRCNRLNLQSAIMNLAFNAGDAMPNGGVISMSASYVYSGEVPAEIEVRVADNGIGMTRDTLIRAFDPFFTTKTKGLGGLGLPMVKRFAEEVGGRIDIESKIGVGTTVTLRLPVAEFPLNQARNGPERPITNGVG